MTDLHADAREYVGRGWSCVPRRHGHKARSLVRWRPFVDRLPSDAELRAWFNTRRNRGRADGIAVITGGVSGALAVRDWDRVGAYERWCEKHPALARSIPTVRTRRGYHVYATSNLAKTVTLPDGEYRGGPALTVSPHSLHATSGQIYLWVILLPDGPLPEVDASLLLETNDKQQEHQQHQNKPPKEAGGMACVGCVGCVGCVPNIAGGPPMTADDVLIQTLPTGPGQRNNRLLLLARGLKFNAAITDHRVLGGLVKRWHEMALPVITTTDYAETLFDFQRAYDRARYPLGMTPIDYAVSLIDPHDLPARVLSYDGDLRRLAALCRALASVNGGKFYLSVRDAAERLGVERMSAWRMLNVLRWDGLIETLDPGTRGAKGRAAVYRWVGGDDDDDEGN
jgi:hypothetical protein